MIARHHIYIYNGKPLPYHLPAVRTNQSTVQTEDVKVAEKKMKSQTTKEIIEDHRDR